MQRCCYWGLSAAHALRVMSLLAWMVMLSHPRSVTWSFFWSAANIWETAGWNHSWIQHEPNVHFQFYVWNWRGKYHNLDVINPVFYVATKRHGNAYIWVETEFTVVFWTDFRSRFVEKSAVEFLSTLCSYKVESLEYGWPTERNLGSRLNWVSLCWGSNPPEPQSGNLQNETLG